LFENGHVPPASSSALPYDTILQQKQGTLHYREDGQLHLVAYTHIAERDWIIVGDVLADEFTQDVDAGFIVLAGAALIGLIVIMLVLQWGLRRHIGLPLRQATLLARQLA